MNAEEISIRIGYDDEGNIHWADMPDDKEALIKKALAFRHNEKQQAIEETIEKMCDEQHDCRWLDTADFEKYLRRIAAEQKKVDIDRICKWVCHNCEGNADCDGNSPFTCPTIHAISKAMED